MSNARRTFSSLRRTDGVVETGPSPDTVQSAMVSIALTTDGQHLLAWLRSQAMQPAIIGATAEQLREAEGVRRAWIQLLDMAEANPTVR